MPHRFGGSCEGGTLMKKRILILMLLVLTLCVGSAFADGTNGDTDRYHVLGTDVMLSDTVSMTVYYDILSSEKWSSDRYVLEVTYPDSHKENFKLNQNDRYYSLDGQEYLGINFTIDAKNVGSEVNLQLFCNGFPVSEKVTYSVQEYCEKLMNDSEYGTAVKKTAESLLTYGDYSKAYFDARDGKDGGNVLRPLSNKDDVLEQIGDAAEISFDGILPDGIEFAGFTLTLESSIGFNAYFDVADSQLAAQYHLQYNEKNKKYSMESRAVPVSALGRNVTFKIGDAKITTSPLIYLYMALNVEADEAAQKLTDLCLSVWDYYEAAQTLIAAETPDPDTRNLNGLEVTIVNWWSGDDWLNPTNAYEEAYRDMMKQEMEEHNFTLTHQNIVVWGPYYTETVLTSIVNNDPVGSLVTFENNWIASLLEQGAFLDVSKLPSIDWSDDKWNRTLVDVMSINGGIYGFAADFEPRTGVFFNKALFTQLGIDPELPYNLQAEGKWNWEEFEKLCKALTVDTDNDGDTDVYGVTGQDTVFFTAALMSDDTYVITKNNDGKLVMNAGDENVLEALNWAHGLLDKGYYSLPEESDAWDYYKGDFYNGEAAMYIEEEYAISKWIGEHKMNVGFVNFPYSPRVGKPIAICRENVIVMPNCASIRSIADDIAFAYDIYTNVPEGYEDDDARWRTAYETEFDERAIDETINRMINVYDSYMEPTMLIPNFRPDWLYQLGEANAVPAAILEKYSDEWQSQVYEFNNAW